MSSADTDLKRTPIYPSHQALGAKLVAFAGWEMPVLYSGVIPEHNATRNFAGLFDVSHMGEIRVKGDEALIALNYLTTNDISKISDGQAQYGAVLNQKGGIVDDIIVYRISSKEFFVCVNASNADKVFEWFTNNNKHKATFENESANWGQIAIQGPRAIGICERFFDCQFSDLKYFRFKNHNWKGADLIVARTGYSGEDGLEIFVPKDHTKELWDHLLESGKQDQLLPCGLGARDSLRLEACLPLHGHELSEDWSALQSGIDRFINFDKGDFVGRNALVLERAAGLPKKLSGFFLLEPGIARQADKVFSQNGDQELGSVTSGTKTPTVNKALGLALINPEFTEIGTKLCVEIRGKKIPAEVVSIPFYKRAR